MWSGSPCVSTSASSRPVPRAHNEGATTRSPMSKATDPGRPPASTSQRAPLGNSTSVASPCPTSSATTRSHPSTRQGHRHVEGATDDPGRAHTSDHDTAPPERLDQRRDSAGRWGPTTIPASPSRYDAATHGAGAGIRRASHGSHSTKLALAASPPAAHAVTRPKALAAAGARGVRKNRERGRHLHDRHQRHRRQVEQQPGHGHAVEEGRRDRQQHQFGRQRRRHHSKRRAAPDAPPPSRCAHSRREDDDGGRGADAEHESGVHHRQGPGEDEPDNSRGQRVEAPRRLIDDAQSQIDHRHRRRARDRCAAAHQPGVEHQQQCDQRAAKPGGNPEKARQAQQDRGQHGDVAARDRDDVIGAGDLQALFEHRIETGAVADENGGRDGGGRGVARPHVSRERRANVRAEIGGALVPPRARRLHLDQRPALHASHERQPAARQGQPVVADARIEVVRRTPQRCDSCEWCDRRATAPSAVPRGSRRRSAPRSPRRRPAVPANR